MKSITAYGHIDKGKLILFNDRVFLQAVQDIGFVNHCKITVEYGNKRTGSQNRYLFGGVIASLMVLLNQDGYEVDEDMTYRFIENSFCKVTQLSEKTGEVKEFIKPLKKLSTDEFEEIIINRVRGWIQDEYGEYILLPHEYYGLTLEAYDRWKRGELSFKQAKEQSKEFHVTP